MPVKLITDFSKKNKPINKLIRHIAQKVSELVAINRLSLFQEYLGKRILDIGLGGGSVSYLLKKNGFQVNNLDITNTSLYQEISPTLYNGSDFPYKNAQFDTGIIICVLHHCADQEKVLKEAMRTCKRLIILEDTYRNQLEKILISMRDGVGNFEFYPHHYRSTNEWNQLFNKFYWHSIYIKEWSNISSYGMYGRQTLFVVESKK